MDLTRTLYETSARSESSKADFLFADLTAGGYLLILFSFNIGVIKRYLFFLILHYNRIKTQKLKLN